MQVTIRLVGAFRVGRFVEEQRRLPAGSTVQQVVEQLQLPQQILGIALLNGEHADFSSPLQDGDRLTLMPILDGG